jgi:protein-disulfide isomerase-like protein with CxxC motif
MTVAITEFTDPGCIWSWSSEPQLRWLRDRYGDQVAWEQVMGVQIDDRDVRGLDPAVVLDEWRAVAAQTGAPVADTLRWVHRSTRPACTAVHAAREQGDAAAAAVLRALREAFFVAGRPPDDGERIAAALADVPDLDLDALLRGLDDPGIAARVSADFERTRDPHPAVIGRRRPGPNPGAARPDGDPHRPRLRYGFPTLIVRGADGFEVVLSGWLTPRELEDAVVAAGAVRVDGAAVPDAGAAGWAVAATTGG